MDLQLSQEEIDLILKRRELTVKRQARGPVSAVNRVVEEVKPVPKKADGDVNGRITDPGHPMHWFESQVFSRIGNLDHEKEHDKIWTLLKMPIQSSSRSRIFHSLCHLDVLWTEGRLPLHYKRKYEQYKKDNGIGEDNLFPESKVEGETYAVPQNKRPWNPEQYAHIESNEIFNPKRTYKYEAKQTTSSMKLQ